MRCKTCGTINIEENPKKMTKEQAKYVCRSMFTRAKETCEKCKYFFSYSTIVAFGCKKVSGRVDIGCVCKLFEHKKNKNPKKKGYVAFDTDDEPFVVIIATSQKQAESKLKQYFKALYPDEDDAASYAEDYDVVEASDGILE